MRIGAYDTCVVFYLFRKLKWQGKQRIIVCDVAHFTPLVNGIRPGDHHHKLGLYKHAKLS